MEETEMDYILGNVPDEAAEPVEISPQHDTNMPCSNCSEEFPSYTSLVRHLSRHVKDTIVECPLCLTTLEKPKKFEKHFLRHPEIRKHPCAICGEGFITMLALITHRRQHRGALLKTRQCSDCDYKCSSQLQMSNHMKATTHMRTNGTMRRMELMINASLPARTSPIDEAGTSASVDQDEAARATNHQNSASRVPSRDSEDSNPTGESSQRLIRECVRCPICNESFRNESFLAIHVKRLHSTRETRVRIPEELRLSRNTRALPNGTQAPPGMRRVDRVGNVFKCVICDLILPSEQLLADHLRNHHVPEERPFECPVCHRFFKSPERLATHERKHRDSSQACSGTTEREGNSASHSQNANPFRCSVCKLRFGTLAALNSHKRNHRIQRAVGTIAKSYKCKNCGRKFKTEELFSNHTVCFSPLQGPNKCSVCKRKFRSISSLEKHQRSHGESKAMACDFCGKQFHSQNALLRHIERHITGKQQHKCAVCKLKFSSLSELHDHKRTHEARNLEVPCSTSKKPTGARPKDTASLNASGAAASVADTSFEGFRCNFCGEHFQHRSFLYRHAQRHLLPEDRLRCCVCNQRFEKFSTLNEHMKSHQTPNVQEVRKETDDVGKAGTGNPDAAQMGTNPTNQNTRGFTCNFCGQQSTFRTSFFRHARSHIPFGMRPECFKCKLKFDTLTALNDHMINHKRKVKPRPIPRKKLAASSSTEDSDSSSSVVSNSDSSSSEDSSSSTQDSESDSSCTEDSETGSTASERSETDRTKAERK